MCHCGSQEGLTKSCPTREGCNEQAGDDRELLGPQTRGPLRGSESGIRGGVAEAYVTNYRAVLLGNPGVLHSMSRARASARHCVRVHKRQLGTAFACTSVSSAGGR